MQTKKHEQSVENFRGKLEKATEDLEEKCKAFDEQVIGSDEPWISSTDGTLMRAEEGPNCYMPPYSSHGSFNFLTCSGG